MDSGGHLSSSIDPPSPRVAVTQTTREPFRTARAMIPAARYASSSGCAHTPRIVPSSSIAPPAPSPSVSERADEVVRDRVPAEGERDHVRLRRERRTVLADPPEPEGHRGRQLLNPVPVVPGELLLVVFVNPQLQEARCVLQFGHGGSEQL